MNLMRVLFFYIALVLVPSVVAAQTSVAAAAISQESDTQKNPMEREQRFALGSFRPEGENKKSAIFIKSDSLHVDAKKRIFTYRNNVQMTQDDLHITADSVVGRYDKDSKIDLIQCEDNVVITKGETMRASSNKASYDVKRALIALTEAPELYRDGNVLNADRVTIFIDEDRSEAEGNVRVKVIQNETQAADLGGAFPGIGGSKGEASEGVETSDGG